MVRPLLWIVLLAFVVFLASIFLVWMIIVRMPADYLTRDRQLDAGPASRRPVIRIALLVVKNVVGLLIVLAGIVMLFTPGQGVISILIGLTLIDLPGKRRLIRRMVGYRHVLATINRIRTRALKPPLEAPTDSV
jgi:archaellum biogenesis protein FlaJ (TadC family)